MLDLISLARLAGRESAAIFIANQVTLIQTIDLNMLHHIAYMTGLALLYDDYL